MCLPFCYKFMSMIFYFLQGQKGMKNSAFFVYIRVNERVHLESVLTSIFQTILRGVVAVPF